MSLIARQLVCLPAAAQLRLLSSPERAAASVCASAWQPSVCASCDAGRRLKLPATRQVRDDDIEARQRSHKLTKVFVCLKYDRENCHCFRVFICRPCNPGAEKGKGKKKPARNVIISLLFAASTLALRCIVTQVWQATTRRAATACG